MIRLLAAALAAAFLLAGPSWAQEAPAGAPGADDSRYMFNRVEDGFLRLDSRSGHVSLCTRQPAGWTCRAVPDERAALESEIIRLQNENGTLKKELLARGGTLPNGVKAAPPSGSKGEPDGKAPKDSELDRMMTYMEKIWRRLVEMMHNVQRDLDKKS
jgi:hypothetical protein